MLCVQACGCYGRRELEELSLVTILGIDKGEYKQLLITANIALPRKMRGGNMSEAGGNSSAFIVSAEGNTLLDGLAQMTTLTSRRTTTAHTQIVIIGEGLARDDAGVILDVFSRNLEFRHNTLVSVCKGSASEFIRKFSWPEETEPSDYLVKLLVSCNRGLGICPLTSIHDFLIAYGTEETEPWAPYLALASPVESDTRQRESQSNGPGQDEGAGASQNTPESIVALLGSAVFRKNGPRMEMVGTLDTKETMAVNMLRGDFSKGFMDIAMPRESGKTATLVFHHYSISNKTETDGNHVTVTFTVRATASMEETTAREFELSPGHHEEIVQTAEQELEALLSRVFFKLRAMDSDVADLGMTVHKHFKTWPEWKQFDWPSKFKDTTAGYDIEVFVFTSGFTDNPPTPK